MCIHCDSEGNSIIITEAQIPYCEQCGDENSVCIEKLDGKCVVYHYRDITLPSKLVNLGLASGVDFETIVERIDDLIGNSSNISLTAVDSDSINLTTSGAAGHTLKADIILSTDTGNLLEIRSTGLFATDTRDGKVRVSSTDAPDYLINQIVGGTDSIVSNSVFDDNGLLTIQPSIDMDCLAAALCSSTAFLSCLINQLANSDDFTDLICSIVQICQGRCPIISDITYTTSTD
jgi:hypothetical protein